MIIKIIIGASLFRGLRTGSGAMRHAPCHLVVSHQGLRDTTFASGYGFLVSSARDPPPKLKV